MPCAWLAFVLIIINVNAVLNPHGRLPHRSGWARSSASMFSATRVSRFQNLQGSEPSYQARQTRTHNNLQVNNQCRVDGTYANRPDVKG